MANTTNLFVELGRMQLTPNLPPYALTMVKARGGNVASAGEIAHAFTYSPYVNSITAIDIDPDVVGFWTHMQDVAKKGSYDDFLREFDEFTEKFEINPEKGFMYNERPVAIGASGYVPFLVHKEEFDEVKQNIGKVKIEQTDLTDFLRESRECRNEYDILLLNNIPEYTEDLKPIFENPPLADEGSIVFAKKSEGYGLKGHVYRKGGLIRPGILVGDSSLIERNMIGEGWDAIDIAKALKSWGYTPNSDHGFIRDRTLSPEGELTDLLKVEPRNGRARIGAREQSITEEGKFLPPSLRDYIVFAFTHRN